VLSSDGVNATAGAIAGHSAGDLGSGKRCLCKVEFLLAIATIG
jgi:hypothetical protein